MYQKTVLLGVLIFSIFLTSCEPEVIPRVTSAHVVSEMDFMTEDSGNEEVPIDDEKEERK